MSNEEILDKNQEDAAVEGEVESTEEALEAVNETEGEALSADELMERLDSAEKKASENWDQLLRTKAEMDNIRRRTQKDWKMRISLHWRNSFLKCWRLKTVLKWVLMQRVRKMPMSIVYVKVV